MNPGAAATVAFAVTLAASALPADGQSQRPAEAAEGPGDASAASPEERGEAFRDVVDVEVVEIDVFVADRRGRPVRGLKRDDFELRVDGRTVEVSNFVELPGNRATRGAVNPGRSGGDGAGPPPLTVVFYLDDLNTHPAHRERLLRQLEEAVEPLRRTNARFMLAAFEDHVRILVPPTRDLDALLEAAAIRPKGQKDAVPTQWGRRKAVRDMLRSDENCALTPMCEPCVDNWGELMGIGRTFAYDEWSRVDVAADGLADLVTTLAGVAGRKAVVHVSSGLPQQPGLSAFTYLVDQVCPSINSEIIRNHNEASGAMRTSNVAGRLNLVSAHANANRVTIFTLDAAGLRASSNLGISFPVSRTALGGRPEPSPRNDMLYATNAQDGLFLLADETGGKALLNSNDMVDLLHDFAEDVSNTYSLGFLLTDRRPTQVRQVEVRLVSGKAKARSVRYRRSFREKTLEERLAEQLMSAAYLGGEENPLGASLYFTGSETVQQGSYGLIVGVVVPEQSATLLPGPAGSRQGRLRLWMLAVEEDQGFRTTVRQTIARVGGAGGVPANSGTYRFEVDIKLPEGDYTVAVGVRDETSGLVSLALDAVTVPLVPP
ncbi:MAG: VWA domain-containing protein [Acidobacteriota bacterium]|nr:VWA domain-containing protein [Acidobacteriota bacterium]MDE3265772.1 VWA domain-containing protein [Acidobacteriota bacterium]